MRKRLDIQDFLARIEFDNETRCWNYTGYVDPNGYGTFGTCVGSRRPRRAHVFSYEYFVGPRLNGMHIHHLCMNRRCANPDHLVQLDPREHAREHHGDTCPAGHGPEHWRDRGKKGRYCRECDRERVAARRNQRKVSCRACGNPRLAPCDTGAERRGLTDSGLCRSCFAATLAGPASDLSSEALPRLTHATGLTAPSYRAATVADTQFGS